MRFYTADPHFGHENIIQYCDRSFGSVEEMDEAILEAWQQSLTVDDVLYILGDIGGPPTSTEYARSLLAECPATVQWIRGNHDRDSWSDALEPEASFLGDRMEIRTDCSDPRDDHPVFLVLDHYPMASWNRYYHGAVQLHGHVHGRLNNDGIRRFDVGVDSAGIEPVPEPELMGQVRPENPSQITAE